MQLAKTFGAGLLMVVFLTGSAFGADFQYMVPVETEGGGQQAFLWIPAEADQVRGIVAAGLTSIEVDIVRDKKIREVCAEQKLAILFLTCGLKGTKDLQKVLDELAEKSGYQELAMAPLFFIGHSAGGPQAQARAVEFAERCFGLYQSRGGGPFNGETLAAGVPTLMLTGQFDDYGGLMRDENGREAWETPRDVLMKYRETNPARLASIVIEPGAGHFGWSERSSEYVSMFLKKAAAARIPEKWDIHADSPPELKSIDHTTGWLSDMTIKAETHAPAAYGDYAGDKGKAQWHFDEAMARATRAFHQGMDRKDQFIRWEDRYWVDAGTRYFFLDLKWVGDGQTLKVSPTYAEKYPSQHNNQGPQWLKAGEPVGNSGTPIRVRNVGGPMVATGPDTLGFKFHALAPAGSPQRMTFLAYSEGNDEYRHTELPGMMPRGFRGLNQGKNQKITFPELANVKPETDPIPLKATSDAERPVSYYIAYGPATIENGHVKITAIPQRATFPIEVKVVAYQFGSGIEPKVKTASPVEQTFLIEKP